MSLRDELEDKPLLHVRTRQDSLGRRWAQHHCYRWCPAWGIGNISHCRACNEDFIGQEGYPYTNLEKDK